MLLVDEATKLMNCVTGAVGTLLFGYLVNIFPCRLTRAH